MRKKIIIALTLIILIGATSSLIYGYSSSKKHTVKQTSKTTETLTQPIITKRLTNELSDKTYSSKDYIYRKLTDGISIISYSSDPDTIIIPDKIDGLPVKEIGGFSGRKGLKKVVIPEGVVVIGDGTFSDCANLVDVTIPNSIKELGKNTFSGCTNLKQINIPESVLSLDTNVFSDTGLTSIRIPSNVSSIDSTAFQFTSKLTSVDVSKKNSHYASQDGIVYSKDMTALILYPQGKTNYDFVMPNNVQSVVDGVFTNCLYLRNLSLSSSLRTTNKSSNMFRGLENLKTIHIPADLTELYPGTINTSCLTHLKNVSVDKGNNYFCSMDGVLYNKKKTELIVYPPAKRGTNYTLPSGVTSIAVGAFQQCTNLTNISIPSTVNSFGIGSFENCIRLKNINIPMGLTTIPTGSFSGCSSLKTLTIPDSVNTIEDSAFLGCTKLINIKLPEHNLHIAATAFENTAWAKSHPDDIIHRNDDTIYAYPGTMPKNTHLKINNKIIYINDNAFKNEKNLVKLTLPEGIKVIGNKAFTNCTNLKSVNIPSSLTTIGEYAFYNCTKLTNISIPDTVTSIGHNAFGFYYFYNGEDDGDHPERVLQTFRIYCNPGSVAEQYAKENGISYSYEHAKSIKSLQVKLEYTKANFNFDDITPNAIIMDGSKELIKGSDYTIKYTNNHEVGTAIATISGIGNYSGYVTKNYSITKTSIADLKANVTTPTRTYTGKALTTRVVFQNLPLHERYDFTVTYKNNIHPGTATVIIKGKGNFTGTKILTFKIVKGTE